MKKNIFAVFIALVVMFGFSNCFASGIAGHWETNNLIDITANANNYGNPVFALDACSVTEKHNKDCVKLSAIIYDRTGTISDGEMALLEVWIFPKAEKGYVYVCSPQYATDYIPNGAKLFYDRGNYTSLVWCNATVAMWEIIGGKI